MATVKTKIAEEVARPISPIFAQMIARKREIQKHIQSGGSFEELKASGYKFVQPI